MSVSPLSALLVAPCSTSSIPTPADTVAWVEVLAHDRLSKRRSLRLIAEAKHFVGVLPIVDVMSTPTQ